MDGAAKDTEGTQKRNSLEDLNKEELIKKCKNLLVIAQRAKQAKDEAGEEVKSLKEQLNALQLKNGSINSESDKKEKENLQSQVSAMQEMLGTLTDQKLQSTMEMDILKKQNTSLENQVHQLKVEKVNVQETIVSLQSQVEELETAAESYKRQINRLSNENESLIHKLETMETEMNRKVHLSDESEDAVKSLKTALEALREEKDCLSEDNSQKKEQMKLLFENFSKEKTELESKLEMGTNKHIIEIQNLTKELQNALNDMQSIEKNNIELNRLVKNISAKNEELILQSGNLNENREKTEKQIQLLETEKNVLESEKTSLVLENQQLNQLLENTNKEINVIRSENNSLKLDKQDFNEKLCIALIENEKLNRELEQVELGLQNLLKQTVSNLQNYKKLIGKTEIAEDQKDDSTSEQNPCIPNIISVLSENFTEFYSLIFDNKYLHYSSSEKHTLEPCNLNANMQNTDSVFASDEQSNKIDDIFFQKKNNILRLQSELQHLTVVISNLEIQGNVLQTENNKLKESLSSVNISNIGETKLENMVFEPEFSAEKNNCTGDGDNMYLTIEKNFHSEPHVCSCSEKAAYLQGELDICQGNLKIKIREANELAGKLSKLEQLSHISETEIELWNELGSCRQNLAITRAELSLVKEELAFVLQRQSGYGVVQNEVKSVCRGILQSNQRLEEKASEIDDIKEELLRLQEERSRSQLEIERLQTELSTASDIKEELLRLQEERSRLQLEVERLQTELSKLTDIKEELLRLQEERSRLQLEIERLQTELSKLTGIKEKLLRLQEERSQSQLETERLQTELSKVGELFGNSDTSHSINSTIQSMTEEVTDLESSVTKLQNELSSSKESIKSLQKEKFSLEQELVHMKQDSVSKSVTINDQSVKEINFLTQELSEVNRDRKKLLNEVEVKSKLLEEKELMIASICQSLQDLNISLKIAKDELHEKVLKLEHDAQNYKLLLDGKNRELDTLKEEIKQIRIQSNEISENATSKLVLELQDVLKAKDEEIDNFKTSLLQTEACLTQSLIKLSEQEKETLVQNISENLKIELSHLNSQLEEKVLELKNLKVSFESKCTELEDVSKLLKGAQTELELSRNELEQTKIKFSETESELNKQLLEINNQCSSYATDLESLKIEMNQIISHKTLIQNELQNIQHQYGQKVKELSCVAEELCTLKSQYSDIQEELIVSKKTKDDVLNEFECMKNKLHIAHKDYARIEEELRTTRSYWEDKAKEVENLSSELVTVGNASAETLSQLTSVSTELNAAKETHKTSLRQLEEMTGQLSDATVKFTAKEGELQKTKQSIDIITSKNRQMKDGIVALSSKVSELNYVKAKLTEDVRKMQLDVLEELHQDMWSGIQKAVTSYVHSEIGIVKRENAELLGEMNEMNQVLKQRGETISKVKDLNNELEQKLKETKSLLETTQEYLNVKLVQIETKENTINKLEDDLATLSKLQEDNIQIKNETIQSLEKEVLKFKECQHELETKTSALEAREETIHNLEAKLGKQAEKLQHELNTRDKTINTLQEELKRFKTVKNEGIIVEENSMRERELEGEISSLKTRIQLLEHEIEELRRDTGDVQSEVMSSSTISKTDESARLKDLEESFEERYTKIRILAVRLKKRVSELTAQQTQLENEKKKLAADKAELQGKVTQLTAHAKNFQTVQLECDRLQDELETQKREVKELQKALELTVKESTGIKVQLQESQAEKEHKVKELEMCVKEKQKLEIASKELSLHINALKKEKETENVTKREKDKELKKLEDELKANEKKLNEEIDRHKNTQELLDMSKQECKKRSVLSLEMEDYERSVADLTQQLATEKSKVKELDSHLETQRDISRGLQEQISLLEQRVQYEEARSKEIKDQLNASRTRLSEVETLALERETSISEMASQIEQQRENNENLVLQLSELGAEKQRLVESGRNQHEGLVRQIHVLEEQVSRLKENLADREVELGDLRAEYENYKVRAQSVLRQKARPDDNASTFSREDSIEELAQLRQTVEMLRSKLEDASSKLQTVTLENNAVQEDRTRVLQRYQDLVDTVQDLRNQNTQLHTQLQEMAVEHREALKSQKLQAETLNQCYKQQLEEAEERLKKETLSLKKELEEKEHRLQHLSVAGDVHPADATALFNTNSKQEILTAGSQWQSNTGFIPVRASGISQQDSENKLEISLLEREEGEGSESVDSTSPRLAASQDHRTELIPLDKLLSSPAEEDTNVSTTTTSGVSPSVELGRTKEQLSASECRIRHLAGLLSEAERDLAKLTQQNQVLKEEIRRQQRSVEREQHAQNFEYLKNVVLKFATLQNGDERSRLVPVLNTILKLSPEETNQLNIVAKGGQDLQGGGRGWGSYLQLWSSTQ